VSTPRRRRKAASKPIIVRSDAAQPFDDRCLSWRMDARIISIWTVADRLRDIAFTGEPGQLKFLAIHRKGETDLVHRDGMFFLVATCEVEQAPQFAPTDWIGVDRGIVNLATTSDGDNHQGKGLARYRRRQAWLRTELQARKAAGSRSAARRLARRSKREARHAAGENHKISKQIVADALALPPARHLHPVQGPAGWGVVCGSGPGLHLPAVSRAMVRAQHAGQPARPGYLRLPPVRVRWPRRRHRRHEHLGTGVRGVGIRQHARP
jgi:hypothetical protein